MRNVHTRLEDRTHDALVAFADEHEVTLAGLAEAVGRWVEAHPGDPPRWIEKCLKEVIEDAARIDAERRERGPK